MLHFYKKTQTEVFISFCLLQRTWLFRCLHLNKSWNMLSADATSCTMPSAVKYYNLFVTVSWLLQQTIIGFSTYVWEDGKQIRVGVWISFLLRSFQSVLLVKNNLTVGANEWCKTFVMVKLYKISLCKTEAGLRSPSVTLKNQWR